MRCPNCDKELVAGKLYCEYCGYEIQIVPDFEPEIEKSISDTLITISEDLEEGHTENELSFEETLEKPDFLLFFFRKLAKSFAKVKTKKTSARTFVMIASVLFVAGSVFALVKAYQYNSYQYQFQQALSFGKKEKYVEAVSYLERAIKIEENNSEATLLLADYYLKQNKDEDAVFILEGAVLSEEANEEIYQKLISIYESRKEYKSISRILEKCSDKEIVDAFSSYSALPPEFSESEGTYEEVIHLKLIGNTTGEIYYTLDGSKPTVKSPQYTTPLFLESGRHVVSAIFINKYGVTSEVSQKIYDIIVEQPNPPEIIPYSGIYRVPEMITATAANSKEKIFYTTDGKIPTMDSNPYNGPIPMPFGATSFKFAVYSEEGVSSEVEERAYRLQIPSNITSEDAVTLTAKRLLESGVILDESGALPDLEGKNLYICSSAIAFGSQTYYLVLEFYQDKAGTIFKTEKEYAVNILTGEVCNTSKDSFGNYQVTAM